MKYILNLLVLTAFASLGIYLVWYQCRLRPELLFTVDITKDEDLMAPLTFGYRNMAVGAKVDSVCASKGYHDGPFFALKERRAKYFKPIAFNSVYGDLIVRNGEKNIVYYYSYSKKYEQCIYHPL